MIRKQWGRCEDRRLASGQEIREGAGSIQGDAQNEAEMRKRDMILLEEDDIAFILWLCSLLLDVL